MKSSFTKNWLVRKYDKTGWCFESFQIKDRFEWEASKEAEDLIARDSKCDDWTMTEIKEKRKIKTNLFFL